jgi:CxC2 like cysteine cluster associated with KDZ transposases
MAGGGVPEPRVCKLCQGDGIWSCRDCLGRPLLCGQCCRVQHLLQPFHRVQRWNGTFLEDSWLYHAGVALHFGHGGHPCPSRSAQEEGHGTGIDYRGPDTGSSHRDLGTGTQATGSGHCIGDIDTGFLRDYPGLDTSSSHRDPDTNRVSGTGNRATGTGNGTRPTDHGFLTSDEQHHISHRDLGTGTQATGSGHGTGDIDTGSSISDEQQHLPTPPMTDVEDEVDQPNLLPFDEIPDGMPLPAPPPPEAEPFWDSSPELAWNSKKDANGTPLVVVDRSGMHLFPAFWCECRGAVARELQALDMGFYPASHKSIRTLFTFQCLDDFLADNQECNTTAYHYIEKLRRLTSSSFPHTAPVGLYFLTGQFLIDYVPQNRYQELMRLERQWRYMKSMEWHGIVHEDREPGPGELTHGCPSCPQPGVNLPDDWQADPRR